MLVFGGTHGVDDPSLSDLGNSWLTVVPGPSIGVGM